MSSTNRGAVRNKDDSYNTPDALALACLKVLPEFEPRRILEPSCGGGAFIRAARALWPFAPIFGIDVSGGDCVTYRQRFEDFTAQGWPLIVGNPPYSLAEPHIRHAMTLLTPGGVLAFLLRVNFLGAIKRASLWNDHPISSLHVVRPRPSFTQGGNDSTEYALFVWGGPKLGVRWIDWDNRKMASE